MDKSVYSLQEYVKKNWCETCDGYVCKECAISDLLTEIHNLNTDAEEIGNEGCNFCQDSRTKKSKELFFFDSANNLRVCSFCPNCGRKY